MDTQEQGLNRAVLNLKRGAVREGEGKLEGSRSEVRCVREQEGGAWHLDHIQAQGKKSVGSERSVCVDIHD